MILPLKRPYTVGPLRLSASSLTDYPPLEKTLVNNELLSIPLIGDQYKEGFRRSIALSHVPGGIRAYVTDDKLIRSPLITSKNPKQAFELSDYIKRNKQELIDLAQKTTHHGKILDLSPLRVVNDVYVRLSMHCGEAAGYRMIERAAQPILTRLKEKFPGVEVQKILPETTFEAQDMIEGRGKSVTTEIRFPRELYSKLFISCDEEGKTLPFASPERIVAFSQAKSYREYLKGNLPLVGEAGHSLALQALFKATNQTDNSLSSVAVTRATLTQRGDLEVFTTLPCLVVNTLSAKNLEQLACADKEKPNGYNSQRLAAIAAAFSSLNYIDSLITQCSRN